MNSLLVLLLVCGVSLVSGCLYQRSEGETHWNYGQGSSGVSPYFWWKVDENCGHGSFEDSQSPIDIANTEYSAQMKALKVSYPVLLSGVATNNGHTANFLADDGSNFKLSKGPLGNDVYQLVGFHFHWGESEAGAESIGSEHSIDGRKAGAEIHFVHANTKYDITDITNHSDGIAVIGVLLEVHNNAENSYDQVFDVVAQVPLPSSAGVPFDINLSQLLPHNLEYYHYAGSLTAPTCNSVVQWIVLRDPVQITPDQLEVLFELQYEEEEEDGTTLDVDIGPNNRPLQALNDRTIYRNFYLDGEQVSNSNDNSGSNQTSAASCAVLSVLAAALLFLHW